MTADTATTTDGKKLLGESVEESRAKRLEKQQSRYRDRGGVFVPADTNPLLDVLLARGVNGESPMRRRSTAPSPSPPRKKGKGRASVVHARKSKAPRSKGDALPVKVGKGTSAVAKRDPKPKTKSVPKSGNKVADPEPATQEEHAPVAGPSKISPATSKRADQTKTKSKAHASKVETLLPTAGEPVSKTARRKGPAKLPMGEPAPRKAAGKGKKTASTRSEPTADAGPVDGAVGEERLNKRHGHKTDDHGIEPSVQKPTASNKKAGKAVDVARSAPPRTAGTKSDVHHARKPEMATTLPNLKRPANSQPSADSSAVPPKRKRPRLYIPPDTESEDDDDDVPIMTTLKAKAAVRRNKASSTHRAIPRAQVTSDKASSSSRVAEEKDLPHGAMENSHASSSKLPATAVEDEQVEEVPAKGRKKPSSQAGASKKTASKASKKLASDVVDDAQAGPSTTELPTVAKDKPTSEVALKEQRRTATRLNSSKKTAAKAPKNLVHDAPSDADAPPRGKSRAKAPAKRKKEAETEAPAEPVIDADHDEARSSKRRKRAVVDERPDESGEQPDSPKAKRLKLSSSHLKENRKATRNTKKAAPAKAMAPKPKPRMSMFPIPEIQDSEDELDLLK